LLRRRDRLRSVRSCSSRSSSVLTQGQSPCSAQWATRPCNPRRLARVKRSEQLVVIRPLLAQRVVAGQVVGRDGALQAPIGRQRDGQRRGLVEGVSPPLQDVTHRVRVRGALVQRLGHGGLDFGLTVVGQQSQKGRRGAAQVPLPERHLLQQLL